MSETPSVSKSRRKEILNIIRTTQRNNIELTHIADNKANVLLSLNALMITILVPVILTNASTVWDMSLGIPILILTTTNIITIYLATLVLKPGDFDSFKEVNIKEGRKFSPFFFGNFHKMERVEFMKYIDGALASERDFKSYLAEDLYYIGSRLGRKMTIIKTAFNIFMVGVSLSLVIGVGMLFFAS